MQQNYKRLKIACYSTNVTMSIIGNLPPLLFLTFRNLYNISYSLLGLLVLINFSTQLIIDLIFSFFSHKFNIQKTVRLMPVLALSGLTLYALSPILFSNNIYFGLAFGTVIFSSASGLAEVLISPIITAIPSDTPERDLSILHSIYAWGVVFVIFVSTIFLLIFKETNWQWLILIFSIIPIISAIFFQYSTIPQMQTPEKVSGALSYFKNKWLWICILAIFFGGASECTMAQWSSSYLEQALGIEKLWGDIFGVALFALMLGLGRTLYGKYGKQIEKILFLGGIGASICYLLAAIINIPFIGLFACAFTGFFVSMLWPGSLIVASDKFPSGGVFIYAMMAAGGDLGASIGPQLVGLITDAVISNESAIAYSQTLGLLPEQFGMKLGMLIGMLFPIIATLIYAIILKRKKSVD